MERIKLPRIIFREVLEKGKGSLGNTLISFWEKGKKKGAYGGKKETERANLTLEGVPWGFWKREVLLGGRGPFLKCVFSKLKFGAIWEDLSPF